MARSVLVFVAIMAGFFISSTYGDIAQACDNYPDVGITVEDNTIQIVGCTAVPCPLKKGTNTTFSGSFKTKQDLDLLNLGLYGQVLGIWTEIPGGLAEPNVCKLGANCPMKAGVEQTIKFDVFIQTSFPKIQTEAELRFLDANKKVQGCAITAVKIVD